MKFNGELMKELVSNEMLDDNVNQILNSIYPTYGLGSIATLNVFHVLALVAISVLLSFLSGLLPARLAAKKDPVEALRSE